MSRVGRVHMHLPTENPSFINKTGISLSLSDRFNNGPLSIQLERETVFEPATSSLARKCSTTEPLPLNLRVRNRYLYERSFQAHAVFYPTTNTLKGQVGGERLELSRFITNRS